MYSRLGSYIKKIESNFKNISQKRKNILIQLNNYLLRKYKNKQIANLIFICKIINIYKNFKVVKLELIVKKNKKNIILGLANCKILK